MFFRSVLSMMGGLCPLTSHCELMMTVMMMVMVVMVVMVRAIIQQQLQQQQQEALRLQTPLGSMMVGR